MMESDPQLGTFSVTARLFKLIYDMPKDQQLILLKQLAGGHVTQHVFKLIVEMSEDQQIILLEQLEGMPAVELPERTVSLEENLLDIIGRPVHVKSIDGGKYQIGIQFDDLDKNATKMLQKYISDGDTSQ